MKEFKKILKFTSAVKCVCSKEKDKYLSVASLDSLRDFLPEDIDPEKDIDFLPIAANAFVANRFNKNDDGVDTETAINIAENFAKRPINIEHNRHQTCGVILSHAYSEYGSNKPLKKEELKDYKKPFNVTLGGIIWRVVDENIASKIEESNDPESEDYGKISFSWEIGYSDYNLVLVNGSSKNLEDGQIITDEESKSKLEKYLRANGGSGKVDENTFVYNLPVGFVLPLGIGLTERPAADVSGVATIEIEENKEIEASDNKENSSQKNDENVNLNRLHKSMKIKIKKVEELTDELLKEVAASDIREFISEEVKQELQKSEEDFSKKQKEKEEVIANQTSKIQDLEKSNSDLKSENEKLNKEIESIKAEINKLQELESARAKLAIFSTRMEELDKTYRFDDEKRKIVAQKIKDLDDSQYESYKKELEVLLKFNSKASEENLNQKNSQQTVETVIDNGKKETITVPNTSTTEPSLQDKYRLAFDFEKGFDFEVGSRRNK